MGGGGIPQFFVPNIHPQVIDQGGAPDPLTLLLQGLQQGQQAGIVGYQEQQQNSRSSADIAIRKQELANQAAHFKFLQEQERTKQAEYAHQQEIEGQKSEAFKHLIPYLLQGGAGAQLLQSQPIQGPTAPGVQPQSLQMPGQYTPGQSPSLDALGAFAGIVSQMPTQAVSSFVHEALPTVMDAQKAQQSADQVRRVDQAISTASPDKQPRLRALYTLTQTNKDLPKEALQSLFPEFYGTNEPNVVNAFTSAFRTGSFTAAQAARMTGMKLPADIDPNTKYPLSALLGRGGNQQAEKAANFLGMMQTTAPLIDALIEKTGGMSIMGEIKKNQKPATGLFSTLGNAITNNLISKDQQQLVTAMLDFSNSWRFAISGAQSSDKEFEQILNSAVEQYGDSPETKHLKKNLRQVMIQGVADLASGVRTRSEVLSNALRLDWTPEQKAFLEQQLRDARQYEGKLSGGTAPFIPNQQPPGTASALQQQLDEIAAQIRAGQLGVRP